MARILVTGGCGFIGAHLCAALSARGDQLRVLDDLSTGHEAKLPHGTEFLLGDINRTADLAEALDGVDACFHLAAIASVERAVQDWPGTHRTNLSATIGLFDIARRRAIPVVYASSAAVYGQGDAQPLEEDAPRRPLSSYGADKLGCEQHARVAGLVHGVPSIGLRFFNVYGPGQDPASPYSGVISIFCDRLARGLPINIFGDGRQTRDFVFVQDVVRALIAALPRASLAAPVVNVCTGTAVTIQGLAQMIASINGMPLDIRWQPARAGEIPHSVGSPARARTLLGLGLPVPLRDGLLETFEAAARPQPGARMTAPFTATASA